MLKLKSKHTAQEVIPAPQQPAEALAAATGNGSDSKNLDASVSHSGKPLAHTVSPKKLAANQKNAQKSTGPRTVVGKTTSSWNALKHGLLSRRLMQLNDQNAKDFSHVLASLQQDLEPVGTLEQILLEKLAYLYFRIAAAAEHEHDNGCHLGILNGPGGSNLIRYQTMLIRGVFQSISQLERLQRQRRGEDVPAPLSVQVLHEAAERVTDEDFD